MADNVTVQYVNNGPGGWCMGCGRKLTPAGRCPNCDAWWASPLVGIGGPLLIATIVALVIGIGWLNRTEPVVETPVSVAPAALSGPVAPRAATLLPPDDSPPARSSRAPRRAASPPPRPISMAEQVRLRQWSAHVDAVIAADDAARAGRAVSTPPPPGGGGSGGGGGYAAN